MHILSVDVELVRHGIIGQNCLIIVSVVRWPLEGAFLLPIAANVAELNLEQSQLSRKVPSLHNLPIPRCSIYPTYSVRPQIHRNST